MVVCGVSMPQQCCVPILVMPIVINQGVVHWVCPEASRFGFSVARCKHANWSVAGMDFMTAHVMALKRVDQLPEQLTALAHPAGQS